jgi:hypothetical protein
MLYNFVHPPIISILYGANILLSTLFSNNLSLYRAEERCLLGCFHDGNIDKCLLEYNTMWL